MTCVRLVSVENNKGADLQQLRIGECLMLRLSATVTYVALRDITLRIRSDDGKSVYIL